MTIKQGDVVLVTGATGFTGKHLVKTLCASGAEVRAIARTSSDCNELDKLPVTLYRGDVYDADVIKSAIEGANYVFHVAAAYREAKISDDVYWKVHVESTKHLANCALAQPDFKRFIHVSTLGVHGHIENPPATEEYRFAPGDRYQETKVEAELWIRGFAEEHSLPITVVRPAAIYGPGDQRLLKVFKMARMKLVPMLGLGHKHLYHLIHVDDLVDFMVLCATHARTEGEVYACGAEDPITIPDMIRTIAGELDTHPRFLSLPVTPFFIAADLCEFVCKPLGIEPPIYRRRVAFFTKDRAFDTSKMRNHTGFSYSYSNESGLTDLVQWYRQEGWL